MRIAEDTEPVELRLADEPLQNFKVAERFAGESDDEEVRSAMPGTAARTLSSVLKKISAPAPRFMRFSTSGEACCSGRSRYLQMLSCLANGFQQPARNAVGIRVEEPQPAQSFNLRQRVEQRR